MLKSMTGVLQRIPQQEARPTVRENFDIIFLTKNVSCEGLAIFQEEMKEILLSQFKDDFLSQHFYEKESLIQWTHCENTPCLLKCFIVTPSIPGNTTFITEMVKHCLIPGHPVTIVSTRFIDFALKIGHEQKIKSNHPYIFSEISILLEKESLLHSFLRYRDHFSRDLIKGLTIPGFAKVLFELKRIPTFGKLSPLYESVVSVMKRFPRLIDADVFKEIQHFMLECREDFQSLRSRRYLTRIILSHYLLKKELRKLLQAFPDARHLKIKLCPTKLFFPFGIKKVMGITIAINLIKDSERFEKRHLIKAIQSVLPEVRFFQDIFFSNQDSGENIRILYAEIERENNEEFTLKQIKELHSRLADEIKNSIERLTPTLFGLRNEEEVYRNIILLSRELRFVRDLPQAMISFCEQDEHYIKFHVILVRLLHSETEPLKELSKTLRDSNQINFERVVKIGLLRKRYVKEANLFTIEMRSSPFLRQNHSVDLIKARQHVVSLIKNMVGEFRDYNGGLLIKQHEQLTEIKKQLEARGKENEFLIENLFYSLTPSIMQGVLSASFAQVLFSCVLNLIREEITSHFILKCEKEKEYCCIVVKTRENSIKDEISNSLKELKIDPFVLASSTLTYDGASYFGYLYLHPSTVEMIEFQNAINKALFRLQQKKCSDQVLRISLPHVSSSLDPRINTDRASGILIKMLFEGLMRIGKNGIAEYGIADNVKIDEAGTSYHFHLRESFWSNGTPLTAHDFVYGWKKILDPYFKTQFAFLFFVIKNAEKVKRGELPIESLGVQALDDQHLVVNLEHPAPYFLALTAHWCYSPLSQEIDKRYPGWTYYEGNTYVSNGPFKIYRWKRHRELQLVKNERYWDQASVKLNRIQISLIEDQQIACSMFERGELDWIGDPLAPLPLRAQCEYRKTQTMREQPIAGTYWIEINVKTPPFNSSKFRQALAYAIDREAIIREVLKGNEVPATRIVPPSISKKPMKVFNDGDIEGAKEIFKEALKELNCSVKDLPPITFSHSTIEEHEALAHALAKQWKKVLGIEVQFKSYPWKEFLQQLHSQNFSITGVVYFSWYDDPIYHLEFLKIRDSSINCTQWENKSYQSILQEANNEHNPLKRLECLHKAETIILEEFPIIPVYFYHYRFVKNPHLKDVYFSNIGQIDFRWATLELS